MQKQLEAEIAARKSLQDFTEMLAARVMELENMQIRRMVGDNMVIDAKLARQKSRSMMNTVSMHGSSAMSRGSTEFATETETESEARAG